MSAMKELLERHQKRMRELSQSELETTQEIARINSEIISNRGVAATAQKEAIKRLLENAKIKAFGDILEEFSQAMDPGGRTGSSGHGPAEPVPHGPNEAGEAANTQDD